LSVATTKPVGPSAGVAFTLDSKTDGKLSRNARRRQNLILKQKVSKAATPADGAAPGRNAKEKRQQQKGGRDAEPSGPGSSSPGDGGQKDGNDLPEVRQDKKKKGKHNAKNKRKSKQHKVQSDRRSRLIEAGEEVEDAPKKKKKLLGKDEVKCKNGHKMEKRTENPKRYTNEACCDVCGVENMPKKRPYFFHCSFCKFDICPQCGEQGLTKPPKKKRKIEVKSKKPMTAEEALKKGVLPRARRETWIPTDAEAVGRAPLSAGKKKVAAAIVSDWVEGVPL